MKLQQLCTCIEAAWPLQLQESYDNVGLLLGHPEDEVHKALLCLDFTEAVLEEAITKGCDVILSHHPAIFRPLKRIDSRGPIAHALRKGIALYAAHTNFDKGVGGVSYAMAHRLKLNSIEILRPEIDAQGNSYGLGVVGCLDAALETTVFLKLLKSQLNLSYLKHSTQHRPTVQRVALCGGAGADLMTDAKRVLADAFLCADTHYHDFDLKPSDPLLIDIGHYESEIMAIDVLGAYITEKLPTFAILKSCIDTNFVRYF